MTQNNPSTVPDALRTALRHHQRGELRQAEAIYRKVLLVEPNNADALHLLGVIANQTGKNELAVDLIGKAIGVNNAVPLYHSNAGNAYFALNRLEEAIACYRRALSLSPGYHEAHYNLGSALAGQGKLEEAAECYRRAVSLRPDLYMAHFNLGNILARQWKMEEAAECFSRAVALKPDFHEAYYNMGNALADQGKLLRIQAVLLVVFLGRQLVGLAQVGL